MADCIPHLVMSHLDDGRVDHYLMLGGTVVWSSGPHDCDHLRSERRAGFLQRAGLTAAG